MTSPRHYLPRQPTTTNPYPTDYFNKITPILGNVAPYWSEQDKMHHGRYLSGVDGLGTTELKGQKDHDGCFHVGAEREFMIEDDEPDWSDPLQGENEVEDDSVGSGIFDPTGGETVHVEMGVFADHPAMPGYIARNPPFWVNPEVQDITADAQVLEVPGGGMAYLEKGGVNAAPAVSPWARFEPYVEYPCQSPFHPRQPDTWKPPPGSPYQPPLGMKPPPHLQAPGSNDPTEPYTPPPPATGTPTVFGRFPRPHRPGRPGGSGGGGGPTPVPPPSLMRPKGKAPPANVPGGFAPPPAGPPAVHGFGQPAVCPVPSWPRHVGRAKARPGPLVPFQRIIEPIDMATAVTPCGAVADGCGYGGFGQDVPTDPNAPAPTPTPTPTQASATGPGFGSYVAAGVVVGVAAYIFYGAVSGKAKGKR